MKTNNFNDKQYQALIADKGPVLILAGAGSGKTRVLTGKIARLIDEKGVDERNILAFTFTNKAAGEMKERVSELLGKDVSHMWIGTFHSICSRILRMNIEKIGYTSSFTIYDSQDQKTLVKEAIKSLRMDVANFNINQLISKISSAKNQGEDPDYVEGHAMYLQEKEFAEIYRLYEKTKKANNALDFDDLIIKTLDLLVKDEQTLNYYQRKFEYVFVDEYQDTNKSQYKLIKLLGGLYKNICVVGDSDQSIYGWRGADITNILNFEKEYPKTKKILLEQNYRSTKKILDAANALIDNNSNRIKKDLWTESKEGADIKFAKLQSEQHEAEKVVEWISHMKYKDYDYKNMAILYRTNAQSRAFEERIMREGIPYKVVGGLKFYDRKEIKDLIAYLNLIVNSTDDLSLSRIINVPKRGIGQTTVDKLMNLANANNISALEAIDLASTIFNSSTAKKLLDFKKMISNFQEMTQSHLISDVVISVYEDSGYQRSLEESNQIEDKSRMDNIDSFINAVSEYEDQTQGATLVDYLQNLSLMSDLDKTEQSDNTLSLMTIHSAKGLEFDIVFVVGMEDGLFPSRMTLEEGNIEEERRLFYVAITRARKQLFLSLAQSRRTYGQLNLTKQSRFIDEIQDHIVEEVSKTIQNMDFSSSSQGAYSLEREKYREMVLNRKKSMQESANNKYRTGDKVKHKKFGIGTIVMVTPHSEGDELTVAFDSKGLKKLNANLAPLEKI